MPTKENWVRPSEAVAARVKRERERQGIAHARLAERCAELGADWLTRDVILNIESGRRRDVSVDEVWVLAAALNLPPSLLQIPLGVTQRFAVTPKIAIHPLLAFEWDRGDGPLVNTNRTARLHPWADERVLPWNEAAAPMWFYERLRELERELDRADDKDAALDALRAHTEAMRRIGLDEAEVLTQREKHYGGDDGG